MAKSATWFDRALMQLAPAWAGNRIKARAVTLAMIRHYESAGGGNRTTNWRKQNTSPDAAASASLSTLRNLSRDVRRNNPWARRAIQVIANNTVGTGITGRPVGDGPTVDKAAKVWAAWSKSVSCDFDGRLTFGGIQRLAMAAIAESGECYVIREHAKNSDGLPVPVRIAVLEADYLDTNKVGKSGSTEVSQGIERDGHGRRVAYWFFHKHPGGSEGFGINKFQSRRVMAKDVIHLYRIDRPGQSRGVPWLAVAIARLKGLDEFEDATLIQQKIAACFGAFVRSMDGGGTGLDPHSSNTDDALEALSPGKIQYLRQDEEITFGTPPTTADYAAFTSEHKRAIAAGVGISYEDMTGDYSKVTFSSARMGRISTWANIESNRRDIIIPHLCDGVWQWVMEMAAGLDAETWPEIPRAKWSARPMPLLEPGKEVKAMIAKIRGGLISYPDAVAELGGEWGEQLQEIFEANKEFDRLGIVLDCDARKVSAAGLAHQEQSADPEPTDDPDDDDEEEST